MRFVVPPAAALVCCLVSLHADGPKDNIPDNVRPIPPPGIEVPAGEAAEIGQGLRKLGAEIEGLRRSLRTRPALLDLLPDVEIFHKAVRYALEYNEFFKTNELAAAKALLKTAGERAQALREGHAPWTNATGLVVRGFRSRIDGSVQPYGLVVPESARAGLPSRLDIWFHGRGETLSEVNFLADHQRNPGQFTPPNTIVLRVYNRYCNPARFAGETDVFEAFEHARKSYLVDDNRVLVRGFSMGGASCWGFATHHAWRWAAAAPGAGFSETAEFLKVFQDETLRPTWWEKKLWRLYDATDYALNLYNVPTVAYSGEEDRQKQAADAMEKAMAKEGLRLTHLVGPKTGHKYEPATKAELERRVDAIAEQGRNPVPARVKFTTFTLRYNRMFWLVVDGLEQHWERARCDAEFSVADNTIAATTKGVTALSFVFEPGQYPLDPAKRAKLVVDGQRIEAPAAFSDRSFTAHLRKSGRTWKLAPAADDGSLAKRHGLQGPIDDAFMDSFIMVFPTGRPMNDQVGAWTATERGHAVEHWRRQFRGEPRIKDDHDVTPEDMAANHLILWGDPQRNEVIKRIADKLPIKWGEQSIRVGKESYNAGHHVPVLIYPNPLNPTRYVVINSGFTYREYDYLNNARQTPKLPDWAIIDISQPITSRAPGRVVAAGFFGEKWELKP
jgi:hypothetical protein